MAVGFLWRPSPQTQNSCDQLSLPWSRAGRWRPHLRNPLPTGLSPGVLPFAQRQERQWETGSLETLPHMQRISARGSESRTHEVHEQ